MTNLLKIGCFGTANIAELVDTKCHFSYNEHCSVNAE